MTDKFIVRNNDGKNSRQVYCRISEQQWSALHQLAVDAQISESEVLRQMIMFSLSHQPTGGPIQH